LYGDSAGNSTEKNYNIFSLIQILAHQQGQAGSKTLLKQNPSVLNWGAN